MIKPLLALLACLSVPAQALDALRTPTTFSALLPCADCAGIRETLTLRPDRIYLSRRTYLGADAGRDAHHVGLGRYELAAGGRELALRAGVAAPRRLAIVDKNSLRLLDGEGREIVSKLNYTLRRAPEADLFPEVLHMHGMYRQEAGAGRFMECASGLELPLKGGSGALEAAHAASATPLLVTLEARIVPSPDGEVFVLENFGKAWPGEACASND